jgi:formylglycine-generating enzyme required for sulfatase activity
MTASDSSEQLPTSVPPDVVAIPAGTFLMGSTTAEVEACVARWSGQLLDPSFARRFESWILKEHPAHPVTLPSFGIGRFPVTNDEYSSFVEAGGPAPPSFAAGARPDHPVWGVSHDEAAAYCRWLGERSEVQVRLPTEAEWERAARGPDRSEFPFGDEFDATACNTVESGIGGVTPVGRYTDRSSAWGVVDLAGNVEEWTSTWYEPYPGGDVVEDDVWAEWGGRYRVLRGGSFTRGGDLARCARRHGQVPGPDYVYRGFRIVVPDPVP